MKQTRFLIVMFMMLNGWCSTTASAHGSYRNIRNGPWITAGFYSPLLFSTADKERKYQHLGLEVTALYNVPSEDYGFGLVLGGNGFYRYVELEFIERLWTVSLGGREEYANKGTSIPQITVSSPFFMAFPYARLAKTEHRPLEFGIFFKYPIELDRQARGDELFKSKPAQDSGTP